MPLAGIYRIKISLLCASTLASICIFAFYSSIKMDTKLKVTKIFESKSTLRFIDKVKKRQEFKKINHLTLNNRIIAKNIRPTYAQSHSVNSSAYLSLHDGIVFRTIETNRKDNTRLMHDGMQTDGRDIASSKPQADIRLNMTQRTLEPRPSIGQKHGQRNKSFEQILPDGQVNNKLQRRKWADRFFKDVELRNTVCESAKIMPRGSMALTALASVPGSGNTWVRYLIERATGIYTGSVFRDPFLFFGGFKGERQVPQRRTVIVVKTHYDDSPHIRSYDKAIILIRNPFDAAISEAHRNNSDGNHIYILPHSYFKSQAWNMYASSHCWFWRSFNENWISQTRQYLVVYYESLMRNIHLELNRIINFLEQPLNETRVACAEQFSEGKFHRSPHNLSFDPFTPQMRADCNQNIQAFRKFLEERGISSVHVHV